MSRLTLDTRVRVGKLAFLLFFLASTNVEKPLAFTNIKAEKYNLEINLNRIYAISKEARLRDLQFMMTCK